jgi:hypothetical protein
MLKIEKELEAASFSLIASSGVKQTYITGWERVRL